ncbi:MAG: site-specific DNA-methyltransferase [Cytophagaceae bacterium]|nr:site-specific DNA-methyltransferase [Cytophagaceae bacterium]
MQISVSDYLRLPELSPLFLEGDALSVLRQFPGDSLDCCLTSPPYWGQRQYEGGGIGLEGEAHQFIRNLLEITKEIKRVLKPTGSFWLNIDDTYRNKSLMGIPWRVAIAMMDEQGWTLRNGVDWNKHKGGLDSSKDKLRNVYEPFFHFVKDPRNYFYDDKAIRANARKSVVKNGAVVSATGVSGVRYKRQLELSTALSEEEKRAALRDLNEVLSRVVAGKVSDFRMIIRGQQRATHSESEHVSGRAKELMTKGYYFLFYHPDGTLPSDVWDILPEDSQKRKKHYAVFPEDLCQIPILATCPKGGVMLDPFCGTGTTQLAALKNGRKSIGIDISAEYLQLAHERIDEYTKQSLGVLQLFNE